LTNLMTGKVAVVTGAGRGIGRAVASVFVRAGATVVVVDRVRANVEIVVDELNEVGKAFGIVASVGEESGWKAISDHVLSLGSTWDILVNCAGVGGPLVMLDRLPISDCLDMVTTNVTGPILGCRAASKIMKKQRSGIIINVSSALAHRVQPGLAVYSGTKAASIQLSAVLAAELVEYDVQVFSIHPGVVDTALVERQLKGDSGEGSFTERIRNMQLLTPFEAAGTFLLLASGMARDMNGKFVVFNDPDVVGRVAECLAQLK